MTQENKEEKFITADMEGSPEVVRLKAEIQTSLIEKYYGFVPENEQAVEWIEKYSEKFQTIFDRLIKADPHFWLHDKESRNATITIFEDELYKEPGHINVDREAEQFEK